MARRKQKTEMTQSEIRIGGACGFWGDSSMATPQFLGSNSVDYIVYDYLAEITMSIMARAQSKDPENGGYATDFLSIVLKHNLTSIAKSGVKLVTNAGGVNPEACGRAVRSLIADLGLNLKVAVITGDNLTNRANEIAVTEPREMFSAEPFPAPEKIASINAYLGAFPIAKALSLGADIVITGRCVDSAVTLGVCIHEFGWSHNQYDLLASGSLAGHILECGAQATGGNFTDWRLAGDPTDIGYPIATVSPDGSFTVSKPANTSGIVSVGAISEQMLYEIGDPQAYILPDVVCDFSEVEIRQKGENIVSVSPARGAPPPVEYKTCATFADGFRTGTLITFIGFDAAERAEQYANSAFARARRILRLLNAPDFTETSTEIIGAGSQFGETYNDSDAREVVVKVSAKHPTPLEGGVLLKELVGLGLAAAPGLSGFKGASPKPSPVIRLFSYLTPKNDVTISIDVDGETIPFKEQPGSPISKEEFQRPAAPSTQSEDTDLVDVPLVKLAWGRSGDKGNKANIGVIARNPDYLPYIWSTLTEECVAQKFAHFIASGDDPEKVNRYFLPGSNAINYLIDDVLGGGGVASIRNDPQGKAFAQILLTTPIPVPSSIAGSL